MQHRIASRRTRVQLLALSVVLGVTVVALSQCRSVNDTITGVNTVRGTISARNTCAKKCDDAYKAAVALEEQRHKNAVKACGSHNEACKKSEDAKHRANLDVLQRQRRQCKGSCYNEGGGRGGL